MNQDELFVERHFAIVTRVEDEDMKETLRGAVFFKSDTLTGDAEWPEPAEPSFGLAGANQEGWFWVPQVGDQIEVEINSADEHANPKYVRMLYSQDDDIAEEFKKNYPHRMGLKTRAGHLLLFDNKKGEELVQLFHKTKTGFEWLPDGTEKKTVTKDLIELIQGIVNRTVEKAVTEVFKAEVSREITGKLYEKIKNDVVREVQGNTTDTVKGDVKRSASGTLEDKSGGKMKHTSGADLEQTASGNIKQTASQIQLNGSSSGVTTENSHLGVIDLITGAPVTPSPTVFADV